MSKTKHTQGPWARHETIVIPWGTEKANVIPIQSGETITALVVQYGPFIDDISSEEIGEANAHLIAAAPEMIEALQSALDVLLDNIPDVSEHRKLITHSRCVDIIQTVILKARGGV